VKINTPVIISLFAGTVALGVLFYQRTYSVLPPVIYKLVDRCPDEKRLPITKSAATITKRGEQIIISHPHYLFRFVLPNSKFRFEENTLQDYEEPISLPNYLYTMLVTYGQTRTENRLSPVELRFIIYPTWCTSELIWRQFLASQGWKIAKDKNAHAQFALMEKIGGGRTYQRYFVHKGSWHYEFEISWDTSVFDAEALLEARYILDSFTFAADTGTYETP